MSCHELPELTLALAHPRPGARRWNLTLLLFTDSTAYTKIKASKLLESRALGDPVLERVPLLQAILGELEADVVSGTSVNTTANHLNSLWAFYCWGNATQRGLTLETVKEDLHDYADHLFDRARRIKNLQDTSAYTMAASVSSVLTRALGVRVSLIHGTRLARSQRNSKRVLGTKADKQNLTDTFALGHLLMDVVSALSIEALSGPLPAQLQLRCGKSCGLWSGRARKRPRKTKLGSLPFRSISGVLDTNAVQASRHALINLAIETQLLMFLAVSSMNLTQALALQGESFRYQSHLDGYRVYRIYKGRRGGTAEFEIHGWYRSIFEAYLTWRRVLFPSASKDAGIFSFLAGPRDGGGLKQRTMHLMSFTPLRNLCARLDVPFFSPQKLRKTKVNWLLRRSDDPELTGEMAQHSKEVLFAAYAQPHHQRAITEISRFHASTDPAISMPGVGLCTAPSPTPVDDIPRGAPLPDCRSPAGCLFCVHQRDIDDPDHVWSLMTFRHLMSMELSRHTPPKNRIAPDPAVASIDVVTAKLKAFRATSEIRAMWVEEAVSRIEEGDYHPKWDGFVQALEAQIT